MDEKFTEEEIVRVAKFCTGVRTGIDDCPPDCPSGQESRAKLFATYIASVVNFNSEQETLSDFDYYISQMFTADQLKAYNVGKSYQALKQLTKLAGEQSD